MAQACDLTLVNLRALADAVKDRAVEHRTHPDDRPHARRARRADDVRPEDGAVVRGDRSATSTRVERARETIRVGKISGAVGTFAHLDPAIEADVCRRLGLEPAPISSQVIQRDRHAELLAALAITAASLEKFALEIRGLQKTEIGEVEEPFGKGQKGSSAMPHKRNPIGCEQIVGLARLIRANAMAALENVALWHERDISHSSVERVILPDSFIALDHMLRRFTRIVAGMVVYPDRMRENLERSRGVVFSGQVLLELARRGVSREQAYEWVQRNAMRVIPRAARLQGSAARPIRTSRACWPRRTSTRRSTWTSSCGTSTRSSTACSTAAGDDAGRASSGGGGRRCLTCPLAAAGPLAWRSLGSAGFMLVMAFVIYAGFIVVGRVQGRDGVGAGRVSGGRSAAGFVVLSILAILVRETAVSRLRSPLESGRVTGRDPSGVADVRQTS